MNKDDEFLQELKKTRRMLQLWFQWNGGGLPHGNAGPDFSRKWLTDDEKKELIDLIYEQPKRIWDK